ncbi:twin-arginine translocation signal domain-containing protein [Novosphingobium sp. ST904]|uniref:twin-arginine translocation signal domain-containing protein n=1 Tax=Novosphingobium sp. ST904 TaxID=1684385 RepID=UPI000AEBE9EA|nr:twin-arginine translocation signal domain-containing protein [Novosphingobium sp. ST904]
MIDRRRFLTSASAGAAAVAAGPALARVSASPAGSDAALAAFMDKYFEVQVDASPETATQLGLDTGTRAR